MTRIRQAVATIKGVMTDIWHGKEGRLIRARACCCSGIKHVLYARVINFGSSPAMLQRPVRSFWRPSNNMGAFGERNAWHRVDRLMPVISREIEAGETQ